MKPPLRIAALIASATAALALASPALASGGGGGGGGGSGSGGSTSTATPDLSKDIELAGEVLVKLRSGDAIGAVLQRYSLSMVSRFGARPIFRLKVIGAARVKDVIAAMATDPDVMLAEPNATNRSPEARGNNAWAIGTPSGFVTQWAPQALHLAQAQMRTRGAGVRVAVLDTGVDFNHPLLAGRLLPGHDFVDGDNDPSEVLGPRQASYGHGTHVAGLIVMIAPEARILPLRVLDTDGVGNAWVLAEALLYALDPDGNPDTDDGAHVINLSLGSMARTRLMDTVAQIAGCAPAVADDPIADRSDPGYADDERRCARGHGAVVVAAAGNDASGSVKEYPAAEGAYGLLSVAASTASNHVAGFSNFGPWVDMAAPGEGITSALPGGLYGVWSGTSMAAPMAAGTAALVRSLDLSLAPKDVVDRLKRTAAVLCTTNLRQVDAQAAVANLVPPSSSCR